MFYIVAGNTILDVWDDPPSQSDLDRLADEEDDNVWVIEGENRLKFFTSPQMARKRRCDTPLQEHA